MFISIYTARLSDWWDVDETIIGETLVSLYRKYNMFSKCEGAHLCIDVNKNIEQRLWSRFQTL